MAPKTRRRCAPSSAPFVPPMRTAVPQASGSGSSRTARRAAGASRRAPFSPAGRTGILVAEARSTPVVQTGNAARPDERGRFGEFGGRYVPETLMSPVIELTRAYEECSRDETFRQELAQLLRTYVGRPTPLYFAESLSRRLGGARILL